ncbi:MAG: TIGR03545 family protein [Planctomycetota bacterium]
MKIVRWKYVLPRLAIVLVVAVTIRFGLDPALKWALVASGESALGAKIDVTDVRTSLLGGQLTVTNLAIANPQSPMRNLLEASDSQLQIDVNALLHGRIVVTDGTIKGLQFDTDRHTSGALAETSSDESTGPSPLDPILDRASEMGSEWFDQLGDRLDIDVVSQLKSPQLAEELRQRWPEQYAELQQQVQSIRTRGKALEKQIREVKSNPLRGLEKLSQLQQDLASIQHEVKVVQQQIAALPDQARQDQQAILAAREQDEALLREKMQIGTLDGEGLTQTLLGQPVTEGLASALEWVRWVRQQVPSNPAKEKASRSRGTTVVFTPPQPDHVIQLLMLEGTAQVEGEPLRLTGSLTNVSSAPRLLPEPTQLILRGEGACVVNLRVDLDRRDDVAKDALHLHVPQWAMAGRSLGNADKFAIEMADGLANFQIELRLEDDQLEGEIRFEQPALQLTPRLPKSPEGQLAQTLQRALQEVNRLEASVALSGTLTKPKFKIESDIGSQVAQGLNSSLQRALQDQTNRLLASSREQVDVQLQKLTQLREQAQQELLGQLGEGQELLGQLAALTGGQPSSLPGGVPKLGGRLGISDLIKK